jgi:hypothetical protein
MHRWFANAVIMRDVHHIGFVTVHTLECRPEGDSSPFLNIRGDKPVNDLRLNHRRSSCGCDVLRVHQD